MLRKVVDKKKFITSTNETNIIEGVKDFSGIKLPSNVLKKFLDTHLG